MSTTSEPQQATTWNPEWLSLSGAIMWVVTRDQTLTRITDEAFDNDLSIEPDIRVRLAEEEVCTGKQRTLLVAVEDAWLALRRLIADEKIVAEGRSLERRGGIDAVETWYPNRRIPSGDAASLIILSGLPGIELRDALGPEESYRYTNWQGRYWYGVRLRAVDVFREFPGEWNGRAPEEAKLETKPRSRGDADLLKSAFNACYPDGVPSGTLYVAVYDQMSKWIERERKRTPPHPKTFERNRRKYWRDKPDTKEQS